MTMNVKPVLEDKFWIVEDEGIRVGTLTKDEDKFIYTKKGVVTFHSETQIKKEFGKSFLTAKITTPDLDEDTREIHGFPTKNKPYNSMFDISRNLPLFTKSEKSKSVYCAGYYLIKFNKNWLKSFCPKLITLERNQYMGPYKTELEMKLMLSNVNRTS